MNAASAKRVILTAAQATTLDELAKTEKSLARYRKLKRQQDRLRRQVDAIFEGATVAVLPSKKPGESRAFLRTVETRDYDPLPAKTIEIVRIHEVPPWDV